MSIRLFRHYVQLPIFLLMLLEAGVAAGALSLMWRLLQHGRFEAASAVVFAGVLSLMLAAMGLYNARLRESVRGLAVRFALGACAAFVVLALLHVVFPVTVLFDPLRPTLLGGALLLTVIGDLLLRVTFTRLIQEDYFKRRVLVYGAGRQADSIVRLKRRADRIGFLIVGYIPAEGDVTEVEPQLVVRPQHSLLQFCRDHDVDEIVVAMDDRRRAFPIHELLQCRVNGVGIIELLTFLERETGKLRLDVLNPSWMIFAEGFKREWYREATSRAFDVLAALGLLLFAWPFMLLTILAIKLEDGFGAPVLYRQQRVGLDGRLFDTLKFRSMRIDAEADGVARWASTTDDRVTRVGRFIRKIRLDELPQLFNVLRGDMRFVGPRPERPAFVAQFAERLPYYQERHVVRPGLTGWAQLCYPYGSSEKDALEKLQYDLYYVKNRSLLFDIAILVQTVEVILFGKGAR